MYICWPKWCWYISLCNIPKNCKWIYRWSIRTDHILISSFYLFLVLFIYNLLCITFLYQELLWTTDIFSSQYCHVLPLDVLYLPVKLDHLLRFLPQHQKKMIIHGSSMHLNSVMTKSDSFWSEYLLWFRFRTDNRYWYTTAVTSESCKNDCGS